MEENKKQSTNENNSGANDCCTAAQNSAIKCDTEGCGWKQKVEFNEMPQWLNKTCPKCGSILMDEKDLQWWNAAKAIMHINEFLDPKHEAKTQLVKLDTAELKRSV